MSQASGGFDYDINVGGNWQQRLQAFRDEVDKTRKFSASAFSAGADPSDVVKSTTSIAASTRRNKQDIDASILNAQQAAKKLRQLYRSTVTELANAEKELNDSIAASNAELFADQEARRAQELLQIKQSAQQQAAEAKKLADSQIKEIARVQAAQEKTIAFAQKQLDDKEAQQKSSSDKIASDAEKEQNRIQAANQKIIDSTQKRIDDDQTKKEQLANNNGSDAEIELNRIQANNAKLIAATQKQLDDKEAQQTNAAQVQADAVRKADLVVAKARAGGLSRQADESDIVDAGLADRTSLGTSLEQMRQNIAEQQTLRQKEIEDQQAAQEKQRVSLLKSEADDKATRARQIKDLEDFISKNEALQAKQEADAEQLADSASRRLAIASGKGITPNNASEAQLVKAGLASPSGTGIPLSTVVPQQSLATKIKGIFGIGDPAEVARTRTDIQDRIKDFVGLSKAQQDTEKSGSDLFFTFRRLFGTLALFTITRKLITGFFGLIDSSIQLNANVENARIGIAALLVASGNVRDSQGNLEQNAKGFVIAQREAARQMELIRRDAQATGSTFQDLVQTFQVGLAPGLKAGLNVDQVREFTVRISQAGKALGLLDNQLSEEIRSILGGTITQRTTRIAASLGISNADIKAAKEQGQLFQFLQQKFAAFAVAGQASLNTFTVIASNLKDSFLQIIQIGTLPFFTNLKNLLKEIYATISNKDPITGIIKPNPQALAFITLLSGGLDELVNKTRIFINSLTAKDLLDFANTVRTIFGTIINVVSGVFSGVINGLGDASRFFGPLADVLKQLSNSQSIASTAETIARIATDLLLLNGTVALIRTGFGLISGAAFVWGLAMKSIIPILSTALSALKGLEFTITSIKAGAFSLNAALAGTVGAILIGVAAAELLRKKYQGIKDIADAIAGAFTRDTEREAISAERIKAVNELGKAQILSQSTNDGQKNIDALIAKVKQFDAQLVAHDAKIKTLNAGNTVGDKSVFDLLTEQVKGKLPGILSAVTTSVQEATNTSGDLSKTLNDLPGVISASRRPLQDNAELIQNLADSALKAKQDLAEARLGQGVAADVAAIQRIVFTNNFENRKTTQEFERDLADLTSQQIGANHALEISKQKVLDLDSDDQKVIQVIKTAFVDTEALQATDIDLQTKKVQLQDQLRTATADQIPAIEKQIAATNDAIKATQDQITLNNQASDRIGKDLPNRQKLVDLVVELIKAEQNSRGVAADKNDLLKEQLDLQSKIQKVVDLQITKEAEAATFRINQKLAVDAPQVQGRVRQAQLEIQNAPQSTLDSAAADAALASLQAQQKQEQTNFQITNAALNLQIDQAIKAGSSYATINALLAEQNALQDENTQHLEDQNVQIQLAKKKKEEARLRDSNDPADALAQAKLTFEGIQKEGANQFELIKTTIEGATVGFAGFISDSIAAAFDPNNDKTIKQRFAEFLADLGKQILDLVIKIELVKAVALVFNGGGAVPQQAPVGRSLGGPMSFNRARGFASGGNPGAFSRPSNISPSDTVPAWLTPGEWVIRADSARRYGHTIMSAINNALIDPGELHALARNARTTRPSPRMSAGFAAGGSVSSRGATGPGGGSTNVLPVVVASRKNADTIFQGGKAELLDFLGENAEAVNRRLRR